MSIFNSKYNWFFKYKLHHLVFWTVYHFLWWSFIQGDVIEIKNINFISFVIFQAIGVYFCLYFLIPKYLEKGKILAFVISTFLVIVFVSLLITVTHLNTSNYDGNTFYEFVVFCKESSISTFKVHAFPAVVGSTTLGLSIKLSKNYLASQKHQRELEKEKLETELKYLKSQFNPHFLFNTINSIFVLINKNSELATESLAKFSSLLRYQLYECNEPEIPLNREILYIKSFIELEKLRKNENFQLKSDYANMSSSNKTIAPFILMPIIENAFKHVSHHNDSLNWIDLKFSLNNDTLKFTISNSTDQATNVAKEAVSYGGLGLKNVQRRLELLYKDDFDLSLTNTDNVFRVSLVLNLKQISAQTSNIINPLS